VDLSFTADVLFFIYFFSTRDLQDGSADWHEILHGGQYKAKFYNAGPKFWGGLTPKNFRCQKHAKFGQILDDFEVRWWISPEQMKIFKIG